MLDEAVEAIRYSTSGGWSTHERIGDCPPYNRYLSIDFDADGNGIVVWVNDNMNANYYLPGTGWLAPEVVGSGGGRHVAAEPAGYAVSIGGTGYSRFQSPDGWSVAQHLSGSIKYDSLLVMNPVGHAAATWVGGGSSFETLWLQRIPYRTGIGEPMLIAVTDESAIGGTYSRVTDVTHLPDGDAGIVFLMPDAGEMSIWFNRIPIEAPPP